MNRRDFLKAAGGGLATAALVGCRAVSAAEPAKGGASKTDPTPNLLFVMCDEMREMAMSCSGDPNLKTPNLDRLAASGFRSTRTYTTSPVCCPARATMQTGYYPHNAGFQDYRNGLHLRKDVPTIGEALKAAGYHTAHIGKWHLNGKKLSPGNRYVPAAYHRGYDVWLGYEHGEHYFDSVHYSKDDTPIVPPDNQYEPDFQTDHALRFIENNAHRPWMMHLSWNPPHFPLSPDNVPADALAAFDADAIQLRDNVPEGGLAGAQRQELAVYYAMISTLDRNLGRLLDKLDVLGLGEKTIVVFTSDHGDMLYSHGNIYKRRPQEESSRIPFIIRYPGVIPAGQVSEEPMSLVDLPGSLTELMGVKPMRTEGMSFVAHWKGDARVGPRDAVFMGCQWLGCRPAGGNHVKRPWRAVRTRSHMACWLQEGKESRLVHLFDVSEDPFQRNDLRDDESQSERVTVLKGMLRDHLKKTNDSFPL